MAKSKNESSNFAWFLAGVTVGAAAAVLYAPRAGREVREALGETTRKGREHLERTGRAAAERGKEFYEQGRRLAGEAAESGREAVERGKKALKKQKSDEQEDGDSAIEEALGV